MDEQRPYQISLDISSNSKLSAEETTSRLLLEYIQLILYLRSQIPEPVQLMCKKLSLKQSTSASLSSYQKSKRSEIQYNNKCMLLLKCLDELKKNIQLLVQHSTEVEAVVAIGSTPVTTKEAFTFKVHIKDNLDKKDVYNVESVDSHARKFCMMMVQSPLCSCANLTPTNTRLFLRGKNLNASEGCSRWNNLRWPPKKHLLSAKLVFRASKLSKNLLIASSDNLKIKNQQKENLDSYSKEQVVACSTDLEETKKLAQGTRPANDQDTKDRRSNRLSAAEVADAILADDVSSDVEESNPFSTACNENGVEFNGIWLELPIVIKGFKL